MSHELIKQQIARAFENNDPMALVRIARANRDFRQEVISKLQQLRTEESRKALRILTNRGQKAFFSRFERDDYPKEWENIQQPFLLEYSVGRIDVPLNRPVDTSIKGTTIDPYQEPSLMPDTGNKEYDFIPRIEVFDLDMIEFSEPDSSGGSWRTRLAHSRISRDIQSRDFEYLRGFLKRRPGYIPFAMRCLSEEEDSDCADALEELKSEYPHHAAILNKKLTKAQLKYLEDKLTEYSKPSEYEAYSRGVPDRIYNLLNLAVEFPLYEDKIFSVLKETAKREHFHDGLLYFCKSGKLVDQALKIFAEAKEVSSLEEIAFWNSSKTARVIKILESLNTEESRNSLRLIAQDYPAFRDGAFAAFARVAGPVDCSILSELAYSSVDRNLELAVAALEVVAKLQGPYTPDDTRLVQKSFDRILDTKIQNSSDNSYASVRQKISGLFRYFVSKGLVSMEDSEQAARPVAEPFDHS